MDKLENKVIVDLTTAAQVIREIDGNPFIVVPNDFTVKDLEDMLSVPLRKRGTATMNDVKSFIDYFNKHKKDNSSIYATVEPSKFIGVLDDDGVDAGWRAHRVIYACPQAKEWKIWKSMAGHKMTQIEFAEFIESNIPDISARDPGDATGADMLEVANNFKAMKKVNFASGQVLANGQVDFKYQEEVTGSAGATGQIKVPERFFIGIPIFEGGLPYRIEAKLRWRLNDGKLSMWFELVRDHKNVEAAFDDIWNQVAAETDRTIYRGLPA